MNIATFVADLERRGVTLRYRNGNLSVTAEDSLLDNNLLTSLRQHKDDILRLLKSIDADPKLPSPSASVDHGPVGLSEAQKSFWFANQFRSAPAYHLSAAFSIDGELRSSDLELAIAQVVARHSALRTRIVDEQGALKAIADDVGHFRLLTVESESEQHALSLASAQAERPFDMSSEWPLRASLFRIGASRYLLALTLHHICCDGASIDLIIREIGTTYARIRQGLPSELARGLQYSDVARWQERALESGQFDDSLDYWCRQLDDAPTQMHLPLRSVVPFGWQPAGTVLHCLDATLSAKVDTLAAKARTTPFVVLCASFAVLMARYTGDEDLVIGSPVSNRFLQELQFVVGPLVNTVALRFDIPVGISFYALLEQASSTVRDAIARSDVPFERVVDTLNPESRRSGSPFFNVMFAVQPMSLNHFQLDGTLVRPVSLSAACAKFDLTVLVGDDAQGRKLAFEYREDRFDPGQIEDMGLRFLLLLEKLLEKPSLRVHDHCLTSASDIPLAASADVGTPAPITTVYSRIAEQVIRTPDAPAAIRGDEVLTYRELDLLSERYARVLSSHGVSPADTVAICVDPSPKFLACVIATQRVGAAYLPLDPTYPSERLRCMVRDASPKVIVAATPYRDRCNSGEGTLILDIEAISQAADVAYRPCLPAVLANAEAAALPLYVIFTSGSTGRPKGSVITHRNFLNLVEWYCDHFAIGPDSRILLISALGFDLTQKNLFAPLLRGGAVVFREETNFDPRRIADAVDRHAITSLNCTPSAFQAIVERSATDDWYALRSLRHVFLGGEPIVASHFQPWLKSLHCRAEVVNTYGPTECADVCAAKRLPRNPDDWPSPIPIGHALPHFKLVAVDEAGQPVPVGAVGELVVGGIGVSWGYLHQPDLTAERFRPLAFGEHGQRYYFTGDLVRQGTDGEFVFLGRRDGQIKLRGFRIELGEIEAAIEQQAGVSRAAAHLQKDEGHEPKLVAFFVAQSDAEPDVEEILQALRRDLPEPAIPRMLCRLNALPHTPSGKVDRNALPAVDFTHQSNGKAAEFFPPVTETERIVAAVWCEVLGASRIGRHDHFFNIGGHSLLAARIVTRLVFEYLLPVEISDLFESPKIIDFCERLDARVRTRLADVPQREFSRMAPAHDGTYSLSLAQERLIFLWRLDGPNATYNMSSGLRLVGRLDLPALRTALQRLTERHAILSVRFEMREGRAVQVPEYRNFSTLVGLAIARDELDDTVATLASRPFDLMHDPVFRVDLLQVEEREHILILCVHHIACDGWSVAIIRRELMALYAAATSGNSGVLSQLKASYFDFAAWQTSSLSSERLQALDDYWTGQLRDLPAVCSLPADRPRPEVAGHVGAVWRFAVPSEVRQGLMSLARRHDASLYMVLLAAFTALAHRLTYQTQIVVGTPVANRVRPEFEDLVGLFVNTLVIRQEVMGDKSFTELLSDVRRTLLNAYEHQDMPFDRLVDLLKPKRSLSHSPLFQMLFVMDTSVLEGFEMGDVHVVPIDLDVTASKFDLNIHLAETKETLSGYIEYDTGLFDAATIGRLANMYLGVLEQVTGNATVSVAGLCLATQTATDELHRLEDLCADVPTGSTVPDLIRAAARAHPKRSALSIGPDSWTYADLITKAEAAATRIVASTREADRCVGVLMNRSPDRAVTLLAVLLAGCAYVPLEPSLPDERLRQIIEATALRHIISDDANRVASLGSGVQLINDIGNIFQPDSSGLALPTLHPDQLAYVITTSGSTGTPKGVLVPHRGVAHHLSFLIQSRSVTPDDRILQVTNFNFDPSVRDLFGTWSAGAEAVLLGPNQATDPAAILDALVRYRVTKIFSLTPTLLRAVLAFAGGRYRPSDFRLDTLMLSGERVTAEDCRSAWALFGEQITLVNQYGPTEATMTSAHHVVVRSDLERHRIPVGRAHPNTRVHVLDESLREVPIGVLGEVFIEGIGLSRGYADDPEQTAEAFVCRPGVLRGMPIGTRLYRTGDIGRVLDDASLDLLGRNDAQVKLRGNRVELGDIEAAFLTHEHVQNAACRIYDDARGDPQLVVFVVAQNAQELDEASLRRHVASVLPAYMHPAAIELVQALPLTPTGKIDRKRLPLPRPRMAEARGDVSRANTSTERCVAAIWKKVLEIDQVGMDTNFFDLGGNSMRLMAVQLFLRDELELDLKIVDLFRHPTVRGLARFIDEIRREHRHEPATVLSDDMVNRIALRRAAQYRKVERNSTSKE